MLEWTENNGAWEASYEGFLLVVTPQQWSGMYYGTVTNERHPFMIGKGIFLGDDLERAKLTLPRLVYRYAMDLAAMTRGVCNSEVIDSRVEVSQDLHGQYAVVRRLRDGRFCWVLREFGSDRAAALEFAEGLENE